MLDSGWAHDIRLSRDADWRSVVDSYTHVRPARFNLGTAVAHSGDRDLANNVAILAVDENGGVRPWTFGDLDQHSNQLANALAAQGVVPGDRVAVWLPQSFELVVAHVAAYKLGAIAVPLFINFGRDAVVSRVGQSAARAIVITDGALDEFVAGLDETPGIELIITAGSTGSGWASTDPQGGDGREARTGVRGTGQRGPVIASFWSLVEQGSPRFVAVNSRPEDPAFLCYTSGTTGPPKGALHGHQVLLGHLAGISVTHDLAPRPGDLFWTPADWGWMGGLFDVLFPALHWGRPVVAHRTRKFDAERTLRMLQRLGVRNAFIPPTALRMMRAALPPGRTHELALRTIASGGEALGSETLAWAQETIGAHVNEFYGQTECNIILGNSAELFPAVPGSMGRAIPGRSIDLVDTEGNTVSDGQVGELVVREGDPVMMLGYWNDEDATKHKITGGVLHTGDLASRDAEGNYYFAGRDDDIISSAGYRIGPTDIENAITGHPAVTAAAVIGKPDEIRGEVVKAVVVLADPSAVDQGALTSELTEIVRTAVGAHAYPRDIEYVTELPMTSTGKIRRAPLRELEKTRAAQQRVRPE